MKALSGALLAAAAVACAPARIVAPLHYDPTAPTRDEAFRSVAPVVPPVAEVAGAEPRTSMLPNGLRVLLVERHDFPVIVARLVVERGALDLDDAGGLRLGQTVYLFGRGGSESAMEAASRSAAGAGISMRTGLGATPWAAVQSPPASLDAALSALADLTFRARLGADEYRQRADEWQEAATAGQFWLATIERRILFGDGHPYGYVAGARGVIPIAEAQALHERLFQPAQATLVVVGDVAPEALDASVSRTFGAWTGAGAAALPARTGPPPRRPAPRVSVVRARGLAQILATTFARGPVPGTDDWPAFLVLGQLLGGAKSSRLHEHLREDTGDAYTVSSTVAMLRGASWLGVRASYDADKAVDGVASVIQAIREQRAGKVTDSEVTIARETLLANWRVRMSTAYGAAEAYGAWRGPGPDPRSMPALLAKVGRDDLARVAKEYLTDAAVHVAFVGEDRWLEVEALGMGGAATLDMSE